LRRGVASKCGRARAVRKTGPFPPAVHRALRGGALPEQDVAVRRMLGLVPGGAEAGRNTDSNRGFCIGGRDGRSSPPWFSRLHVPAAYLKSRNRKITNENYFPAAAELIRVCRPGGLIAMANWTPEGFVGKSFQVIAEMVPPPAGLPVPALWGNEQTVRQRFAKGISKLSLSRHKAVFDYPFSPKEVVDFFRQYFGPIQAAISRLYKEGQSELASRLESLWAEHNTATAGGTRIEAEYLDVRAIRS